MKGALLVTGATGFLGRAVVEELAGAGYRVHALAREASDRSGLDPWVACWHVGDIVDRASLDEALTSFAAEAESAGSPVALVHAAALISYRTRDAAAAHVANVEGTRNVVEAAVAAGVPRLLHVSSVVAVGQAQSGDGQLNEDACFNGAPLGSHYVSSKREAELVALAAPPELEVVVVNPGAIFGVSARASNTRFFVEQVLGRGTGPMVPPGSLSVVGLTDTARGVRLALEHGRDRRRYLLTESNWRSVELMATIREVAGLPPRRSVVAPRWLWRVAVAACAAVDRVRPGDRVTPQSLRLLGEHYRFDAERAHEELGWSPEPFRTVLAQLLPAHGFGCEAAQRGPFDRPESSAT